MNAVHDMYYVSASLETNTLPVVKLASYHNREVTLLICHVYQQ